MEEVDGDPDKLTPSWVKSFKRRNVDRLKFGTMSRGETKETLPPNVREAKLYVNNLQIPRIKEALNAGRVINMDEKMVWHPTLVFIVLIPDSMELLTAKGSLDSE